MKFFQCNSTAKLLVRFATVCKGTWLFLDTGGPYIAKPPHICLKQHLRLRPPVMFANTSSLRSCIREQETRYRWQTAWCICAICNGVTDHPTTVYLTPPLRGSIGFW